MTNRDRVAAELPTDMRRWMAAHANADLWERVGRTVAVTVGRRLLVSDGEGGWNTVVYGVLRDNDSPGVRLLAEQLGCRDHVWSAHQVTKALQSHFGLHSAYKFLSRRLASATMDEPASTAA